MVFTVFENGNPIVVGNSQIPRHDCTPSEEQIKQSLEDGLKVDNVPGPNQWPSHWLLATTASIQTLKKAGYIALHV